MSAATVRISEVSRSGDTTRASRRSSRIASAPCSARHDVLRLELVAAAGSEPEAEVREPLARGAGHAQLLRAVLRVPLPAPGDAVALRASRRSTTRAQLLRRLHPDLADRRLVPHREQADAVGALEDRVQVGFDRRPRKLLEDVLAEDERRDHVERHAGHEAERSEAHNGAVEIFVAATEPADRPVRTRRARAMQTPADNDWLRAPEPCVPVAIAPPTETCGSDARFGSARPWLFQRAAQVAVADTGFDGDRLVPDLDDAIEVLGREEHARRVRDEAEGVACAERPERLGVGDQLLRLVHRPRPQDPLVE